MIYTGNYHNCHGQQTVSISGDKGSSVEYQGDSFSKLAPRLSFWKIWHANIGIISEEENNKFYIEQYYQEVLSKLNAEKIYNLLEEKILLCYEDPLLFCHRHIVAAWLENKLGIFVPEVRSINGEIIEMEPNLKIREDYKKLILRK